MADVSFNVFNPYQQQQEELARRQKLAEIMQQQALQPIERTSYAGIEAPISPYAGLAKVLQMYTSGAEEKKIAEEKKLLNQKYQSDLANVLAKASELQAGKPATPEQAPITPVDDEGNPMPGVPAMPGVAPDPQAAAREYMKHPATQALGMQMLQKNAQMQAFINAGMAGNNVPAQTQISASTPATPLTSTSPPTATQASLPTLPQAGNTSIASRLSSFGGPAGGLPMQVWMQIDPTGGKYTEQLAKDFTEQNKLTDKMRELRAAGIPEGSDAWNRALTDTSTQGGIWSRDPKTGKISLAPGYAEGLADVETAKLKAAAPYEIVEIPVTLPNGTTILQKMTKAQAIANLGGGGNVSMPQNARSLNLQMSNVNEAENLAGQLDQLGQNFRITVPKAPTNVPTNVPTNIPTNAPTNATASGFGMSNPVQSKSAEAAATGTVKAIIDKLDASFANAQSSEERLRQVQSIKQVLDSPLISGPGATTQMLISQIANKIYGVANEETLANTRQLITGLSELSLSARGALKGQGNVTDSDQILLTKARSSQETLTVPEYKRLFSIFEKQDKRIIEQHEDIRKRAEKANIPNIDFWRVDIPSQPQNTLNLSPAARDAVNRAMGR